MRNDKLNLKRSTLVLCPSAGGALGQSNVSFYVAKTASDSNPGTQSRRSARFNLPRTPPGLAVPSTCRVKSTKIWKASMCPATRARGLITLNRSQVEKQEPSVTIDQHLYDRASGSERESMERVYGHGDRDSNSMFSQRGMTVIPVF
jgi:hypothetical protein